MYFLTFYEIFQEVKFGISNNFRGAKYIGGIFFSGAIILVTACYVESAVLTPSETKSAEGNGRQISGPRLA
jgi:hypothetical protein